MRHMESKLEAIVKILNLIAKEDDEYSDVLFMLANELDGIAYEIANKSDNEDDEPLYEMDGIGYSYDKSDDCE